MLLEGAFVFGALHSLLCDFDNDIDLSCRSGFNGVNIRATQKRSMNGANVSNCVCYLYACVYRYSMCDLVHIKKRDGSCIFSVALRRYSSLTL